MKRLAFGLAMGLILPLLVVGCGGKNHYRGYTSTIFDTFDTMIQITAYTKNEEEFNTYFDMAKVRFEHLHRLFDIYHDYEGLNNIKTINDRAGREPVPVEEEITALILFCQDWYEHTGRRTNIALGPVLKIWHDYRIEGLTNPAGAVLPPLEKLQAASQHTDINKVMVDETAGTVFLADSSMALDMGAVAKGFAVEIVARELAAAGLQAGVINAGGNVRTLGIPPDGREKWTIGIEDPARELGILASLNVQETAVVTSSGQQRHYQVEGEYYHHIIDPQTLMPATFYRAVTVITPDSGRADFLSTALFLLPYTESRRLAEELEDVEAIWIMPDGGIKSTGGIGTMISGLHGGGK